MLTNIDELFEREELAAAPDVGWPDCFNSGVFVFRPSDDTYASLLQFALTTGSFDGAQATHISLCSYRVRGVGGSCAEHLTLESYTIIISLQSYLLSYLLLLVFHHPLTLSLYA